MCVHPSISCVEHASEWQKECPDRRPDVGAAVQRGLCFRRAAGKLSSHFHSASEIHIIREVGLIEKTDAC